MINHHKEPTDPNRNPIHVLRPNLPLEISRIGETFSKVVQELLASGKLQMNGIIYSEYNDPATKTPDTAWGTIRLNDGFQMFLWTFCYCLYVFHNEMTIKRNNNYQQGRPDFEDIDMEKLRKAMALMEYAMSLLDQYIPWNETLPNPAVYSEAEAETITKVNALYLQAMNFVIGHELAHLELDHTQVEFQETISSEEMEKQADARSIEFMQEGITADREATVQIGLLAALCTLLQFSSKLQHAGYPDSDDRIGAFIEKLKLADNNDMWALAVLAFRLWDSHYKNDLFWPQNMISQKEVYYYLRSQLKGQLAVMDFTISLSNTILNVKKAKVYDKWQYQIKIEGITMHFASNESGNITGIINTQNCKDEILTEICEKLTQYQNQTSDE